ncbi:MAG: LLM class flavin-dependent oxidoreductase, partial [Nitrospinae bacterium]|nr:LLM class flavin-dependent oxidoreductase [Nitrospinota bacterium]
MEFGMFFLLQYPEEKKGDDRVFQEALEQMIAAEELGYDAVWLAEHHFSGHGICGSPLLLAAAAATRTKRVRVGTAISILPFNHPVRVAERAAVLDILSNGRMDLGTGRSTTLIEMDGFEVNPEETRAQWEEAISIIPRMWTEDPFSHEGRFYNIPPRSVVPKPVQSPHP